MYSDEGVIQDVTTRQVYKLIGEYNNTVVIERKTAARIYYRFVGRSMVHHLRKNVFFYIYEPVKVI
jgi:hypothetical protein